MKWGEDRGSHHILIMAAPPTPNGDLHVGHLSGPFLSGDILSRYFKLRGAEVHYFCGTDDNQSQVRIGAEEQGFAPQQAADLTADKIAATLSTAWINIDQFVRPNSSPWYLPAVQELFLRLYDQGKLIAHSAPASFCGACQQHLYEGYISGRCPHCGDLASGSGCDGCGLPNNCIDLLDAACRRCGAPASIKILRRLYFPLSQYRDELRKYWNGVAMSTSLRLFCERALDSGPSDLAVTHYDTWGVRVAVDGFEQQTIFTWLEEAGRYLAYALYLGDKWEDFWKSENALAVQCFGFDNSFYYAVFMPALLMAFDRGIRLPAALIMNDFCLVGGAKMSTSRGNAVWGQDVLEEVPSDALRFYLATKYPEKERMTFSWSELREIVNRELIGQWQPWLEELGVSMRRDFGDRVPSPNIWADRHRRFLRRLHTLHTESAQAYEVETFSPQRAVRTLNELVREARRFAASEESWHLGSDRDGERQTAGALELFAAKLLALLSAPILPRFAEHLWKELGYETTLWDNRWEEWPPSWLPEGQTIRGLGTIPYFRL